MSVILVLFASRGIAGTDANAVSTPPADQRLQRLMVRFHRADRNGDGQLTREEARNGMPRVYRHFSEIDAQNLGYVTLAQIASYLETHPQSR